ncbi:MAG: hypothetical protein R2932_47965 [Caldilineaceae bacterium]
MRSRTTRSPSQSMLAMTSSMPGWTASLTAQVMAIERLVNDRGVWSLGKEYSNAVETLRGAGP